MGEFLDLYVSRCETCLTTLRCGVATNTVMTARGLGILQGVLGRHHVGQRGAEDSAADRRAQCHYGFALAVDQQPGHDIQRPGRADNNLAIPLWQLVRASTAAPTYFPPEVVTLGERDFVFVDGALTTYNNPAFQLFLMATLDAYRLCWPATESDLLLVSVGHRDVSEG